MVQNNHSGKENVPKSNFNFSFRKTTPKKGSKNDIISPQKNFIISDNLESQL